MTETISITNYSADRYTRLLATLEQKTGLKLTGATGEVKKGGVDLTYSYDAATQVLTVHVLHGPHFADFKTFCGKLQAYIEAQA